MSVYKRGGRYWFTFIFSGRRIQKSAKVKNAKDARDIERAEWNRLARGEAGLPDNSQPSRTVGELLDILKSRYGDEKKLSQQQLSVIKLARRAFGSKLASDLTSKDVESYITEKRKDGAKNATVNRVTETLRRAYRVAKFPAPEIRHLSEKDNARKGFFANDEFRRVCAGLPGDLGDFALFGFLTGWRKGEIASLTWPDIEDGVIRLRAENSKNGEGRSVVIAGELVPLIEARKQARFANGVLTNFVFHRAGDPIREFRKSWATACVAAGVGKMVCSNSKCTSEGAERKCPLCKAHTEYRGRIFHDLRRTAVRNMMRSGVPQSVAMKISGHKTSAMFRRYDITDERDLRQAMESVERHNESESQKVVAIGKRK